MLRLLWMQSTAVCSHAPRLSKMLIMVSITSDYRTVSGMYCNILKHFFSNPIPDFSQITLGLPRHRLAASNASVVHSAMLDLSQSSVSSSIFEDHFHGVFQDTAKSCSPNPALQIPLDRSSIHSPWKQRTRPRTH